MKTKLETVGGFDVLHVEGVYNADDAYAMSAKVQGQHDWCGRWEHPNSLDWAHQMTRTYALMKLLQHGALTMAEITKITGWPSTKARQTVKHLTETERIVSVERKWTKC